MEGYTNAVNYHRILIKVDYVQGASIMEDIRKCISGYM